MNSSMKLLTEMNFDRDMLLLFKIRKLMKRHNLLLSKTPIKWDIWGSGGGVQLVRAQVKNGYICVDDEGSVCLYGEDHGLIDWEDTVEFQDYFA